MTGPQTGPTVAVLLSRTKEDTTMRSILRRFTRRHGTVVAYAWVICAQVG